MKTSTPARAFARLAALLICFSAFMALAAQASELAPLRVLFFGDEGHHRPADRFKQLQPVLAKQGIELVYTDRMEDLNPAKLAGYDCLAIFANDDRQRGAHA
jgi:hypothetical protein